MAIKIYIDQGHNPEGPNTGSDGIDTTEAQVTYEVGIALYNLLNANQDFEARLSRTSPDEVLGVSNLSSLQERVTDANRWGADYFISIHTNAFANPAANGSEAFVYSSDGQSYIFAEYILSSIVENLDMTDRGVKIRPSLYVLRKTRMPSTLIELGFITNPSDAAKLRNNPNGFANAIYKGILEYFGL